MVVGRVEVVKVVLGVLVEVGNVYPFFYWGEEGNVGLAG